MKSDCLIEILTPKMGSDKFEAELEVFAERYREVMDAGYVVSVPDNPMGIPRFQIAEVIEELELPVHSDQLLMHINTFHTKSHLDSVLAAAGSLGMKNLLIVSGDGGERLSRLEPEDLGSSEGTATSVELIEYILRHYPKSFSCGVAFNPYELQDQEIKRLRRKIEAGARFVATQPIFGANKNTSALKQFGLPVFLGVWMSKNLSLLAQCVGRDVLDVPSLDPFENVVRLRGSYPKHGLYVSMLGFKTQWSRLQQVLQ